MTLNLLIQYGVIATLVASSIWRLATIFAPTACYHLMRKLFGRWSPGLARLAGYVPLAGMTKRRRTLQQQGPDNRTGRVCGACRGCPGQDAGRDAMRPHSQVLVVHQRPPRQSSRKASTEGSEQR